MEWTREQRYRKIEDVSKEEYEVLKRNVAACPYREKYHIQPITGLLNDPNGFSYFNGEYHLFYQWFPLGPVHGLKYWYHVSSKDLVHWNDCGVGLEPNMYYESHGVFSGSGYVENDKLHLFYTGNTRDQNWIRKPYQCLAIMDKEGKIEKYEKPLICDSPMGYTDNYRDPKVFKQDDTYYCLIGAETDEHIGVLTYYSSSNMIDWQFHGELKMNYRGGFMLECPDYFEMDNKGIFLFCSQGQESIGDNYQNIFPSGFIIGDKTDFKNPKIIDGDFQELDRGFDFYAPQTLLDDQGRRILIGWLGLPGIDCITEPSGWAHCLTLPRELVVIDNILYQRPVKEFDKVKTNERMISTSIENEQSFNEFSGKTYILECSFSDLDCSVVGLKLRVGEDEETVFYYDRDNHNLVLDRSKSGKLYAKEYGTTRKCNFNDEQLKLAIFVDTSSIEIFVNGGLEVFTSRIYTKENSQGISFFTDGKANLKAKIWDLNL